MSNDDDGHRVRYEDTISRQIFEVKDPQVLNAESLLDADALQKAQEKAVLEMISE